MTSARRPPVRPRRRARRFLPVLLAGACAAITWSVPAAAVDVEATAGPGAAPSSPPGSPPGTPLGSASGTAAGTGFGTPSSTAPGTPSSMAPDVPSGPLSGTAPGASLRCSRAAEVAAIGADYAAAREVTQSVAVVDRRSGELVATLDGDRGYNTESLLKTFTATYYLTTAADAGVSASALRTLISRSDNGLQSELWTPDIVPTVAARYGLTDTRTSPYPTSGNWGSDRTTAVDQARFVAAALADHTVGPSLGAWMSAVTPTAADGFDQFFGIARAVGDRGAKQGWSDPGWEPANLHSVGWIGHFAIAILQTSSTASYATMRSTSTVTAQLLAADARCDEPHPPTRGYRAV